MACWATLVAPAAALSNGYLTRAHALPQHTEIMENQPHLVFVYGTLRRRFENHHLLSRALFVGPGLTVHKYALYLDDYPYCVDEPVSHVRGELYKVEFTTLLMLDALEEHPRVYQRKLVEIERDDKKVFDAWLYFYPHPQGKLLLSGDFAEGI